MNEQIANAIDNFINSPVGSIISGVLGGIVIFLIIFSKTSLGKKLFNKALNEIYKINEIARLSNEKVNNIQKLAEDKINALTIEYERKSAIVVAYYNELEKGVYEILEVIPNQKVKEQLLDFKTSKNISYSKMGLGYSIFFPFLLDTYHLYIKLLIIY